MGTAALGREVIRVEVNPQVPVRGPALRERLLRMHADSGLGHFGPNLSCLDILEVLHHEVMDEADDFVLSKGHAAGALYAVLWSQGRITETQLRSWCAEPSRLPGHPVPGVPGVIFSTGSLGHGFSLSLGRGLGHRWGRDPRHVWCLMSDGEWQEGASWEALMLAAHLRPSNVTVVVDVNGWQGFGSTADVLSMADLPQRVAGFGVPVVEVDGHDQPQLAHVLVRARTSGFTVVMAHTVKGLGTSLADTLECHYVPLPEVDRP